MDHITPEAPATTFQTDPVDGKCAEGAAVIQTGEVTKCWKLCSDFPKDDWSHQYPHDIPMKSCTLVKRVPIHVDEDEWKQLELASKHGYKVAFNDFDSGFTPSM